MSKGKSSVMLKSIHIDRETYGERKGLYTCSVVVSSAGAEIKLATSEEFVEAILKRCAGELINELNRSCFEFTNEIAIAAGLSIDASAEAPEQGPFRMLTQ